MIPTPIALGLTLCGQVIVEKGTEKISIIGSFNQISASGFPFIPSPFCACATLTGAQGNARVSLTVTELQTDEEIFALERVVRFSSRFAEIHILFRLERCQFPAAGVYAFNLLVDGDWVAHRRVRLYSREAGS